MFCSKCGHENDPGSSFCSKCGSSLQHEADIFGQSGNIESDEARQPRPAGKPRKGLVILLVATGAVVALTVAIILFISSRSIQGEWYNRSLGIVIDFKSNGELLVREGGGTSSGEYSYDIMKGSGSLLIDGQSFTFEKDREKLNVAEAMGNTVYYRAGDDTDMYEIAMESAQQNSPVITVTDTPAPALTETAGSQGGAPAAEEPTEEPADEGSNSAPADETETPVPTATLNRDILSNLSSDKFAPNFNLTEAADYDLAGYWYGFDNTDGELIVLEGDGTYSRYHDDSPIDSGTYEYDYSTDSGVMYSTRFIPDFNFSIDEGNNILYFQDSDHAYARN